MTRYIRQFFACFLCLAFSTTQALALPLIRDAEIEHTLRLYADPIFAAAGVNPAGVKIFIVNEDVINAFVAGGQNMFIFTGLILACDTPDMLIGVMAHETGHIAGGHLAQGSEKIRSAELGSILTYVLGAAAGLATRNAGAAAAVIGGGQNTIGRNYLAYSRAHEQAADQSALTSLDKLDISASGFMKVFALLQRDERAHMGSPDPYMLTHPLSAERIDHVRNHVETSSIPEGQYPHRFDMMHKRMLAKLYGFLEPPEHTLQKYPLSDKSQPARMARAIAYDQMPDLPRALAEMDSLVAQSPNDPFFHELRGQILFDNARPKDALVSYQKAVALLPNSPLILADLAKVELAQNDARLLPAATAHLEKSTILDNSNDEVWHLLAASYGKQGNMRMSYLALAEEAALDDDPKEALKQVNYALQQLKEGTPARQRAQDLKSRAIALRKEEKDGGSMLP